MRQAITAVEVPAFATPKAKEYGVSIIRAACRTRDIVRANVILRAHRGDKVAAYALLGYW
jgi:hypothetical protein